ncbi:ATP-dependent helicase HrpB [Cecembia sp.]|uniref:ATP-dependent helicase HrpB n=1 Tax=Cecembia sp. TaxID=1898110 RepID=UPI0025C0A283|nr:ATP-dependent helicase HrpB [Cecembia sp.]
MSFPYASFDLPIVQAIPEVQSLLKTNNTLILHAPPGAGKSTLLPLTLLEETFLRGKKVLMLEPRRLAAKSIAFRMAELLGEEIGKTVGYRIRFESVLSSTTRLEVLTEGILTRIMQHDNALEEVGLVIFDEFHERSIHADLAMALCRQVQEFLRPDLRILIMSATLDMPQLADLLGAKTLRTEGRIYPVSVHYKGDYDPWIMHEFVAKAVIEAAKNHNGDILVFLPGQGEIRKTVEILKSRLPTFLIYPLYGQLSAMAQQQALRPNKQGKRKVVISTAIAETSLTIEGVSIVIDAGYSRISKFNPRSGMNRLETVRVTLDAADQRAGRAGRLGPGTCYRLWSKATHSNLEAFRVPEILEADLSSLVLDLANWGVRDILSLTWLSPPPLGASKQAQDLLEEMGALEAGKITGHGRAVHRIPAHPRIAHMLLTAKAHGNLGLATDIAALLEEKDPLGTDAGVDINLRLEALRRARKESLSIKGLQKIEKAAKQFRKLFDSEPDNNPFDPFETGLLIASAYPERIACSKPGNNARFQLANGRLAMFSHKDDLANESWLAISHIDERDNVGKIFMASPMNPKDLVPFLKEKRVIQWDLKKGGLIAQKTLSIGGIVLRSEPLSEFSDEEKLKAISHAIRSQGEKLLNFSEEVIQFCNRVCSLRIWNQDEDWPDYHIPFLLQQNETWLGPYVQQVKKNEDLNKLDLKSILFHQLNYGQQEVLDSLAPERIKVPSGTAIKVNYGKDGEVPVLAVRLQEIFGMLETPRINAGKTPLLLHLLSPGFKPVQVTSDLRSFWQKTYFEVKKDLKRRYPKHAWPENPLEAQAIRGVPKNR